MTQNSKDTPLLIIDGYGFVFRAYHVQPPLTSPGGVPVGAIYGLTSMLIKLINDFKPAYAVMVLDSKGKNFRHDLFEDYKAHRPEVPDDLISQLPIVREVANSMNFCAIEKEGFEADDIIGTIATKCTMDCKEAIIISSDKDLMQLLSDTVRIYDPMKSKFISEEDVLTKFGVTPSKVRDVMALIGDSSDNIPGVKGVGPKTASELINNFGSLKKLYESIDQVKNPRQKQLLSTYQKEALISWELVGLDNNVDIKQDIESFTWSPPPATKITEFITKYGFKSLNKRIENLFNLKIDHTDIAPVDNSNPLKIKTITINSEQLLSKLSQKIDKHGIVAVAFEERDSYTSVSIALDGCVYLLNYESNNNYIQDLFTYSKKETYPKEYNDFIDKLFSDYSIKKITNNLKNIYKKFHGQINSFDDLSIMDYCLSAGEATKSINEIILHYTKNNVENCGSILDLSNYFIECYEFLKNQLFESKILHLYETIDLPLCRILDQMEKHGVKIDSVYLQKLSSEFNEEIVNLEKEIFKICNQEFNISSPKQLGEVLFDKLNLPFSKISGKTKIYGTGVDILEKLSEEGYDIADLILKYRHLTKLKNTYTETLPKQVDKISKRIHTTFLQTSTTTGRLSSKDPNVQNIPIRTQEGQKIRKAFIAPDGYKLISADYSQIELRILSHVADVTALKQAFKEGKDIHAETASQIFSVGLSEVTQDLRYKAKAINFGIIYGISGFGLAKNLNISKKEATDYIEKYFKEYPGIEKYMADTVKFAKENSYVENLLGRRCYLPMINHKNHAMRSFAERAAINAPMQSLTADIAKMAMVAINKILHNESLKTKMIMQIHDELIFEAPISEVGHVNKLIKSTMEYIITLDVPIKVDISYGDNWGEI